MPVVSHTDTCAAEESSGILIPSSVDLSKRWRRLERVISLWWDRDVHTATEEDVKKDPEGTLLFLPYPYVTPGGSEAAFPEIYGWDTYYVNCALLVQGRYDLARHNILNQLYQIKHHGMTLNGNRTWYQTRSQPPLWTDGVERYLTQTGDTSIAEQAYILFCKEYETYWLAEHHSTPVGLATNRDIGDTDAPALHAESETGLDFFAGFEGDVRNCAPLITNCILVHYAQTQSRLAERLGHSDQVEAWSVKAAQRAEAIQRYCWDETRGFYFEYQHQEERRIPVWSLNAYWAMWAGIASDAQAAALVGHLEKFRHPHGLSMTDRCYPSPHRQFTWVQWGYPAGWPPFHVMVTEALLRYGYRIEAMNVATAFLDLQIRLFEKTEKLWEKYNVVSGDLNFPVERYRVPPLHGWSSASVVLLGRLLGFKA